MNDEAISMVATVAAEEYLGGVGRMKHTIVALIRNRVDVTLTQAWLMVEAIDAYEDQREVSSAG